MKRIRIFTKEKAIEYNDYLCILSKDEHVINTRDKYFDLVDSVSDCDVIILPFKYKSNDELCNAFVKLAQKNNKKLMCFHEMMTDDVDTSDIMINVSNEKSEHHNVSYVKLTDNLDEFFNKLFITVNDKINVNELRERLTWKIINVYKCHIIGKENNFINDNYDIDSYHFFKSNLAKKVNKLDLVESDDCDVLFSSVYGIKRPECGKVKIFYNGESKQRYAFYSNVERILKDYDYYIGFDVPTNERMFRLPYWMTMFDFNDGSIFSKIMKGDFKINFKDKTQDCTMIATTDFNLLRSSVVARLFESGVKVHCPSKICKNTSMPVGREGERGVHFFYGKLSYLRSFKVELCFENTNEYGYVTEKLFGALMTGCIPVYWGSSFDGLIENELINMERVIILKKDLSNLEDVIEKVQRLVNDEQYYNEFFNKPIFKKDAFMILKKYLNDFDSFIQSTTVKI
jgi:hypothetical protein